jgi:hypothetical protein
VEEGDLEEEVVVITQDLGNPVVSEDHLVITEEVEEDLMVATPEVADQGMVGLASVGQDLADQALEEVTPMHRLNRPISTKEDLVEVAQMLRLKQPARILMRVVVLADSEAERVMLPLMLQHKTLVLVDLVGVHQTQQPVLEPRISITDLAAVANQVLPIVKLRLKRSMLEVSGEVLEVAMLQPLQMLEQ